MTARGRSPASTEPVRVGRYHSLCTRDVPDRFRVHAGIDGMAMAISDAEAMQIGRPVPPGIDPDASGRRNSCAMFWRPIALSPAGRGLGEGVLGRKSSLLTPSPLTPTHAQVALSPGQR